MLFTSWRKLPLATRMAIATNFGVEKKGSTEVFDNQIVKDGFLFEEIEAAVTVDSMQKFLSSGDADFDSLFDKVVARVEGREVEIVLTPESSSLELVVDSTTPVSVKAEIEPEIPEPKKRGRPKKK